MYPLLCSLGMVDHSVLSPLEKSTPETARPAPPPTKNMRSSLRLPFAYAWHCSGVHPNDLDQSPEISCTEARVSNDMCLLRERLRAAMPCRVKSAGVAVSC